MPDSTSFKGVLHKLRKSLGYWKYIIFDGGHKEITYKWRLKRLNRWAARTLNAQMAKKLIRPIITPVESPIELHMLCGHSQATMAIWSLWSLLRWAEGQLAVVIHSDGSLTEADFLRFRKFFPNVQFISKEEGHRWAEQRFAGSEFDYLRDFRKHICSFRVLSAHRSEHARTIVMLDSDVLFFERPTELLERLTITDPSDLSFTSFCDEFDWVSVVAPHNEFYERCGVKIQPEFNAGMIVVPKFEDEQFQFLERMLRSSNPEWRTHYFAEQILLAFAAGEYGCYFLPPTYQIGQETNSPDAASIHYVSNKAVRPRFFTEGINRLLKQPSTDSHSSTPTPTQASVNSYSSL